ncbi:MAG: hypothetical protein AB8G17_05375 [Gammaproteobacteria bacterium]
MSDIQSLRMAATSTDDTGEWRPFKVWAAQVKDSTSGSDERREEANKENWDPYAVWKRQVRR